MKGRTIALDHYAGREAAALIVDGELHDLLIEPDAPAPGTIYRARAGRLLKGQGGAVLETPDGPAFLRQTKGISPGSLLLVQVSGYAEPGKAIPVTTRLIVKSRFAIATPDAPGRNLSRAIRDDDMRDCLLEAVSELDADEIGLILRSACADAHPEEVSADATRVLGLAQAILNDTDTQPERLLDGDSPHHLAWRDWTELADLDDATGSFERHNVLDMIDALREPRQDLGGGAFMWIEPTRALIAVDVNTGQDTSLAAGLRANMALARALPRALRLRGLGGQITLDLAPAPKKERRTFETALKAAFRKDDVDTVLAGWTPLGHFELQRKRGRCPLDEVLG